MQDEALAQQLAKLRERWIAKGIANDKPATDADIAAFEARYAVVLPSDIRAYFTTVNGTAIGAYGMQDEYLLGFWHLNEVRSFAEVFAGGSVRTPSSEEERTFVIADYSIWGYRFGIQLSADPKAPTPIVADVATPYHVVASSFSEFLAAYLRGDEDVICL